MIINHKYKFIYLKTRKTASTSIEIALSKFCDKNDIITPLIKKDEKMRKAKEFARPANCRVPLHYYGIIDFINAVRKRKLKHFSNHKTAHYVKKYVDKEIWNNYYKFTFERNPFDKAVSLYYYAKKREQTNGSGLGISEYLKKAPIHALSNWSIYTIKDRIAVDFVGKYENLEEDLKTVKKNIGLPDDIQLPKAKSKYRPDRTHYSKLLDPEDRDWIELVCAKEFKMFNYKWKNALVAKKLKGVS